MFKFEHKKSVQNKRLICHKKLFVGTSIPVWRLVAFYELPSALHVEKIVAVAIRTAKNRTTHGSKVIIGMTLIFLLIYRYNIIRMLYMFST